MHLVGRACARHSPGLAHHSESGVVVTQVLRGSQYVILSTPTAPTLSHTSKDFSRLTSYSFIKRQHPSPSHLSTLHPNRLRLYAQHPNPRRHPNLLPPLLLPNRTIPLPASIRHRQPPLPHDLAPLPPPLRRRRPFMRFWSALATLGSGLLFSMNASTSTETSAGFQILAGIGVGMCNQLPYTLVQHRLKDSPDLVRGSAMVSFCSSQGPVIGWGSRRWCLGICWGGSCRVCRGWMRRGLCSRGRRR